MFKRINVIEGQ